MGIMGVAANTSEPVNSIPPAFFGGNIDINELGKGSTVYYPVQVLAHFSILVIAISFRAMVKSL